MVWMEGVTMEPAILIVLAFALIVVMAGMFCTTEPDDRVWDTCYFYDKVIEKYSVRLKAAYKEIDILQGEVERLEAEITQGTQDHFHV